MIGDPKKLNVSAELTTFQGWFVIRGLALATVNLLIKSVSLCLQLAITNAIQNAACGLGS